MSRPARRHRRPRLAGAVVATVLALAPRPGVAQEPSLTDLALRYLESLYALDFERLEPLLAPGARYLDPTGRALVGRPFEYRGRAEIITRFTASAVDSRATRFELVDLFEADDLVVLTLRLSADFRGSSVGADREWVSGSSIRAVTILRFQGGLVREHTDYVDYVTLLEQIAAQRREPRTPPRRPPGERRRSAYEQRSFGPRSIRSPSTKTRCRS